MPLKRPDDDGGLIDEQVATVFELLKKSEASVIIAGNGVRLSGSEKEFLTMVDVLKIPVVVSKLGQDLIDYNHPYFAGFGGTKGTRAANFAMQNSDLLISIGSRLAIPFVGYEYDLFARGAKKISVDIDSHEMQKKTIKLDMAIKCRCKAVYREDAWPLLRRIPCPRRPNGSKNAGTGKRNMMPSRKK